MFALLGTRGSQGTKNDVDDSSTRASSRRSTATRSTFDYRGMNQALVDMVTVADVIWASELLAKIPDGHWQAAFKAGAYQQANADRYIGKIKEKIAQGLALKTHAYALDAGRCSFNSVTRSRCASTASGSSCSAA